MLRTALLAVFLLLPAAANAAQAPEEAYKACLIGHSVIGMTQLKLDSGDAYARAVEMCSDVAATVPADFCSEESPDACGSPAVSEYVIHYFGSVVAPLLGGGPL